MLTRIRYKNLKALRDVSIDLSQLTILVGPNAVGKSTALDGLELLLTLSAQSGGQFAGAEILLGPGRWNLAGLLTRGTRRLSLETSIIDSGVFSLSVKADPDGQPVTIDYRRPDGSKLRQPTKAQSGDRFFSHRSLVGLNSVIRLRLSVQRLAAHSPASHQDADLASDGGGLPTLLQQMAADRDGTLESLEASLRRIVPTFRRIRTRPTSVLATNEGSATSTVPGFALFLDFEHANGVPAAHASEGTILALGLLAAVHGPQRSKTILMDDLEHGLHVGAQHRLMAVLRELLENSPDLQIVGTTHSPDLVDACPPESVRVLGHGPTGTVARSLTEHPEAEKWLKLLRTGEFWSSAGENWVSAPVVADG